ncbi:MAG: ATP/GTP-binding protein [Thermosphaera sp.]
MRQLPSTIVFAGMAGSGKTSIVAEYSRWLAENLSAKIATVNLDPGVEDLPYEPVFDIRKYFTLSYLMRKYRLGPNAAFLKSAEEIEALTQNIMQDEPFTDLMKWDYILIDTPGQLEAFIFRPESRKFLSRISRRSNTVIAYLIDSSIIDNVPDAVTSWFMYVLIQLKTGLLTVPIISKSDVARNPLMLRTLIENPSGLIGREMTHGLQAELLPELINIAEKTRGALRAVLVSIYDESSLKNLNDLLHEAFCVCGDLT